MFQSQPYYGSQYNINNNTNNDTNVDNDTVYFPQIIDIHTYNNNHKLNIRQNVSSLYLQSYWSYVNDKINTNVQRIYIECSDTILSTDESKLKLEKFINLLPPNLCMIKFIIFFNIYQFITPHNLINNLKKIKLPHNCRLEFEIVKNKFISR